MCDLDHAVIRAQIKWLKLNPGKASVEFENGIAYLYRDGSLFAMMNEGDFDRLRDTAERGADASDQDRGSV